MYLLSFSDFELVTPSETFYFSTFRVSWTKWSHPCLARSPKNHWNNFLLSWIYITMQKILFIPSINSWDTSHQSKNFFWSTFNLCELVSTCKNAGYFTDLFWRYGRLKNPAISLAEKILAHTSGTRIFQYGICAGTEQIK